MQSLLLRTFESLLTGSESLPSLPRERRLAFSCGVYLQNEGILDYSLSHSIVECTRSGLPRKRYEISSKKTRNLKNFKETGV